MLVTVYLTMVVLGIVLIIDGIAWIAWPRRRIQWRRRALRYFRLISAAGMSLPVSDRRRRLARGGGAIGVLVGSVILWQTPIEITSVRECGLTMRQGPTDRGGIVAKIDRRIQQYLPRRANSAMSIVIRCRGSSAFLSYGTLRGPHSGPPSKDTLFEIGSITKVFTSVLLAYMAEGGDVDPRAPVADYLPQGMVLPEYHGVKISLEDLACHHSGLPRLPDNLWGWSDVATLRCVRNPYARYTFKDMSECLSRVVLTATPGAQYEYSNFGAGLLGAALTTKSGMSYEEMVTETICRPLKMDDTGNRLDGVSSARLAPGHDRTLRFGNMAIVCRAENWNMAAMEGAGALRSTAHDMLQFLIANLEPDDSRLGRALRRAQKETHRLNDGLAVGLGWHILNPDGEKAIYWHNGMTGGYSSYIAFSRAKQAGVVVLSDSAVSVDEIGAEIMRELCVEDALERGQEPKR